MLRVTQADRLYAGFDLSMLGADLKPDRVVTAADLVRDGLSFPAISTAADMLLPEGKTPAYLGQAVAMLVFHDFARFRFAKEKLQFNDAVIRYGASPDRLQRDPWGAGRFVRVGGKTALRRGRLLLEQAGAALYLDLRQARAGLAQTCTRRRPRRAGHVSRQGHRRGTGASAGRLAGDDARLRHAVGRDGAPGARQRQRLVRCGQAGAAPGRGVSVAAGSGGRGGEHAGREVASA